MKYKSFEELFDAFDKYTFTIAAKHPDEVAYEVTLEDMQAFLKAENFSETHAEEIFKYYSAVEQSTSNQPKVADFTIRKKHPKLDTFFKKYGASIIETLLVMGVTIGIVSSASFAAGDYFLGSQITGDAAANAFNFGSSSAIIGAATAAVYFVAKKALTTLYYRLRYGNKKTALKQLNNGTDLENTNIVSLINKIGATNEKILNLKEGKKATAPFRWIARHALNIVNRNRIHHVEAVIKDLVNIYYKKLNDVNATNEDKFNDPEMKNIVALLQHIQNFIDKDIETSKLHALLKCKDNSKGKHPHMIENIDIYATLHHILAIFDKDSSQNIHKIKGPNSKQKQKEADILLNGENAEQNLLRKALQRYIALHPEEIDDEIDDQIDDEIDNEIDDELDDEVDNELDDQIDEEIDDELDNEIDDQVDDEVDDEVDNEVDDELDDQIDEEIDDEVDNELDDQIDDEIDDHIDDEVDDEVDDEIDNQVDDEIDDEIDDELEEIIEEEPVAVEVDDEIDDELEEIIEEEPVAEEVIEEKPVVAEEEPVVEVEEETIKPLTPETSLIKRMITIKSEELKNNGRKVTITDKDKSTKETIKVTATKTKINVEIKTHDGIVATSSVARTDEDVNAQVNSILNKTAQKYGVDLDKLTVM